LPIILATLHCPHGWGRGYRKPLESWRSCDPVRQQEKTKSRSKQCLRITHGVIPPSTPPSQLLCQPGPRTGSHGTAAHHGAGIRVRADAESDEMLSNVIEWHYTMRRANSVPAQKGSAIICWRRAFTSSYQPDRSVCTSGPSLRVRSSLHVLRTGHATAGTPMLPQDVGRSWDEIALSELRGCEVALSAGNKGCLHEPVSS
jgi:hypothetical protein